MKYYKLSQRKEGALIQIHTLYKNNNNKEIIISKKEKVKLNEVKIF